MFIKPIIKQKQSNMYRGQATVSLFCSILTEIGKHTLYRDINTDILLIITHSVIYHSNRYKIS